MCFHFGIEAMKTLSARITKQQVISLYLGANQTTAVDSTCTKKSNSSCIDFTINTD